MVAQGLQITLREGPEMIPAHRVVRTLDEVVLSLRDIDKVHLLRGTRATWVMADMRRRERDLVFRLKPRDVPFRRDAEDMMVPAEALVSGALALARQPVVPELFSPGTVVRLAKLATPGDGIESVSVATYNGHLGPKAILAEKVRVNAREAVRPYQIAYGSVSGTLSAVRETTRGKSVRVTVRDPIGKQAIVGVVPERMAEVLRDAWRHRVLLTGKVRRNAYGQAIRIDVDGLELLPEGNSGRPSVEAVLGAGADWLDGMDVDTFMDEVRGV